MAVLGAATARLVKWARARGSLVKDLAWMWLLDLGTYRDRKVKQKKAAADFAGEKEKARLDRGSEGR